MTRPRVYSVSVQPSLTALLSGIVDYAGLFPPAALSMQDAVAAYARHRESPERWMLGRFVCPITRLEEFAAQARPRLEASREPWPLTVLGRGGPGSGTFVKGLWEELSTLASFADRTRKHLRIESMEIPLPPAAVATADANEIEHLVEGAVELLASHATRPQFVFFEIPLTGSWRFEVPAALRALAEVRRRQPPLTVGAKIRTGGTEAASFPPPEALAFFLVETRDRQVPFKATAGLHHPVRRFAPEMETTMHGFLNVFGGAVLAHRSWLDARSLLPILQEEDAGRFQFDEAGFAWSQVRAETAEVEAARHAYALSFGCCSFEEPVEDLRRLQLLP